MATTTKPVEHTDHYEYRWYYDSGDGIWFAAGEATSTKDKYCTYSPPENARRVKISVKPVSTKHKVNKKEVSYWTGSWVSTTYNMSQNPPEKCSTPTVTIDKYELTATNENVSDARTDEIQYEVYNGTSKVKTGIVTVQACRASFKCTITAGGDYRVRARSINLVGTKRVYADWSDFSSSAKAIPSPPTEISSIKATSETSVYLEWPAVDTAETYDLEYATKLSYFDGSDSTTTVTGIEFNHYEKTGLETGEEYFFRVRSKNEKGESSWSPIKSIKLGKAPEAPTTWSSATTVTTGDPLNLYWVHNAEDGSSQTYAELELYIDGVKETHTIKNTDDPDLKDKTSVYSVDTSTYLEGTKIQWRVRTAGVTLAYGDWSVQRVVDIYAPPTLELNVTNQNGDAIELLESFPFYVKGFAGPETQTPIGYHLEIFANQGYDTLDYLGNDKVVAAGESVFSKYYDTNDPLLVEFTPGNIDLENNVDYTVKCTVSMNSGLTAETTATFEVSWDEVSYEPEAEIGIDEDGLVAYITPFCHDEEGELIENVYLAVYRREFDGAFTEIQTNIDGALNTVVTDPHPALDYARYRIVSIAKDTGAVAFYDPPGYPVQCKEIIIQWDETWSTFDTDNPDSMEEQPWVGSMLRLPYNVDVSDSHKQDVSLVNYIGRIYPVSYYGTSVDVTSTWNVDIDKSDEDTLYALRRLSMWMGDCYVREPSGSGYWASLTVSFSQKHCNLVIPVTLSITRVEGGM